MEHWYSFIYLYGVGGALFFLAIIMGVKKGVLKLKRRSDRALLFSILSAYFLYFLFQGVWNFMVVAL